MMTDPPVALIFLSTALLAPFIKGRLKSLVLVLAPIWALLLIWHLPSGSLHTMEFLGLKLVMTQVDGLSRVFAMGFGLAFLLGIIYGLKQTNLEHCSALVYAGGAFGVTFAGDFFTLYIFWEVMAVASTFLVLAAGTPESRRAALRYVLMHLLGGLLLLAGILLRYQATGLITLEALELKGAANWLIFLGVGLNAAIPLLHTWLPDAYARASITGSVFLCAFTTKSAVYVMARLFAGNEFLIYLGGVMAVFPIIYALLSDDIREVLSYSLISQIGYMMAGIGIGTALAINGAAAHAFCHLMYKALLFMAAGAIITKTGRSRLSELGGVYNLMPCTAILMLVGVASISAFPLFSGFVSKSMILAEAGNHHLTLVWLLLNLASAGVMVYLGMRLPYYALFRPKKNITAGPPPANMLVAMVIAAAICIGLAVFPSLFYQLLPHKVDYHPYHAGHIAESLQMLGFGGLVFVLLLKFKQMPEPMRALHLDFDWFYRMGFRGLYRLFDSLCNGINRAADQGFGDLTATICSYFRGAPASLAKTACGLAWGLRGLNPEQLKERRSQLDKAFMSDSLGAGLGVLASLIMLLLIFILA
jgi:multicomponent Na+:H+ antiporter subunit D